jgi:hypothetical protein
MMALLKVARGVYGYSIDNFTDGAGYTALAAMLTPDPSKKSPVPIRRDNELGKSQATMASVEDGKR